MVKSTTRDTEPGATTPATVHDIRNTSDIRLVVIEIAKAEERLNILIENNKDTKFDFRWTWTGLVAGFLILAGLFIYGYDRLDDRIADIIKTTTKIDTKLDDLLLRIPPVPSLAPRR